METKAGELFRQAREKKSRGIKETADAVKIPLRFLEALESGNFAVFGGKVYGINYAKLYAVYLEIPEGAFLETLIREWEIYTFRDALKFRRPPLYRRIIPAFRPAHGVLMAGSLAILLIGSYFSYQLASLLSRPEITLAAPLASFVSAADSSVEIKGSIGSEAKVFVNKRPVPLDENGGFNERLYLAKGLNRIDLEAVNLSGNSSKLTEYITVY